MVMRKLQSAGESFFDITLLTVDIKLLAQILLNLILFSSCVLLVSMDGWQTKASRPS